MRIFITVFVFLSLLMIIAGCGEKKSPDETSKSGKEIDGKKMQGQKPLLNVQLPKLKPDYSSQISIVESALNYKIETIKQFYMPFCKLFSENYLKYYDKIKDMITGKEKEKIEAKYKLYKKFLSFHDDMNKRLSDVKIKFTEPRTVKVTDNDELYMIADYFKVCVRIINNKVFGDETYSAPSNAEKENYVKLQKQFFKKANEFLKSYGIKDDIFGLGENELSKYYELRSRTDLIKESVNYFKTVSADYQMPYYKPNKSEGSIDVELDEEKREEKYLVVKKGDKYYLCNFDFTTGEVTRIFKGLNFMFCDVPKINFNIKNRGEAAKLAAEIFLYEYQPVTVKSVKKIFILGDFFVKYREASNKYLSPDVAGSVLTEIEKSKLELVKKNMDKFEDVVVEIQGFEKGGLNEIIFAKCKIKIYSIKEVLDEEERKKFGYFRIAEKIYNIKAKLNKVDGKWLIAEIKQIKDDSEPPKIPEPSNEKTKE